MKYRINKLVKYKIIFLISFFCICKVYSQKLSSNLIPQLINGGTNYYKITFSDDNIGWICDGSGFVYKSTNMGITWVRTKISNSSLSDICFIKGSKNGFIAGDDGIFSTKDGGNTWNLIKKTNSELEGIALSNNSPLGIAVGYKQGALITINSGQTWDYISASSASDTSIDYTGCMMSKDGKIMFLYGDACQLSKSEDNGKNWVNLISPKNFSYFDLFPTIFSIYYDNLNNIWAACGDGSILHSTDKGKTWLKPIILDTVGLFSIYFDSNLLQGWVISQNGKIYKTTDKGIHWKKYYSVNDIQLNSIFFDRKGMNGWICGNDNLVLKTTNFGRNWIYDNNKIRINLNEFYMNDRGNELIIVGDKGNILKTTDSCKSWKKLSKNKLQNNLYGIYYSESINQIWAVGDSNLIYSCDGNGKNGTKFNYYRTKGELYSISFSKDLSIGYAVGDNSLVLVSSDAGQQWKIKKIATKNIVFSKVFIKNKDEIWIAGNLGSIYYTNNGGKLWRKLKFEDTTQSIITLEFSRDYKIGYAVSYSKKKEPHVYKSLDGGISWNLQDNFPINKGIRHLKIGNENNIIAVSNAGNIYKSEDLGQNWFKISPKLVSSPLNYSLFDNKNNVTIIGNRGAIIRSSLLNEIPDIRFTVEDISDYYRPNIVIKDLNQKSSELSCNLEVNGDLLKITDPKLKKFVFSYDKNNSIINWPKEMFKYNHYYTLRLLVFDGWNIISKDTVIFYGESLMRKINKFMYWDKFPPIDLYTAFIRNISALGILYVIIILLLFFVYPIKFVLWHEAVANSKVPFPEKISKFLVLFLIETNRSLNAFVKYYQIDFIKKFNENNDVISRQKWVTAPFKVENYDIINFSNFNHKENYVPGLTEIKEFLDNGRVIISIEGPGGFGKSSLAFQLARWGIGNKEYKRLNKEISIPIFIK